MSGLIHHLPCQIVQQALIDAGIGIDPDTDPETTWNVYHSLDADSPDGSLVIKDTTGIDRGTSQITGIVEREHGVQVTVRAARSAQGGVKAHEIRHWMETAVFGMNVTVAADGDLAAGTYRLHCFANVGDVLPLGPKEQGTNRYLFTINATAVLWQLS